EGIKHVLSVPKNPEQNGVAERFNRTVIEAIDDAEDAVPDENDVRDQNDVPDAIDDRETNTEIEGETDTVRRSGTCIYTADAQRSEP
uniref:Integrase catalytic domain-containing protein n=1 Tax=Amphimedon queenslandica TaxID=400682 RepID=A0A1X7TVN1_AMPQE